MMPSDWFARLVEATKDIGYIEPIQPGERRPRPPREFGADGLPRRGPVVDCGCVGFLSAVAACTGETFHYPVGCMTLDCLRETCVEAVKRRRAGEYIDRIARGNLDRVPGLVGTATVPPEYRAWSADAGNLRVLETAWIECYSTWLLRCTCLNPQDWTLGGVLHTHPTGDDLGVWHPHPNILCPAVAVHRKHPAVCRRLRFHYRADELRRLRAAWGATLSRLVDESVPLDRINVFHEFAAAAGKKVHAAEYYCRSFPGWHAAYGIRSRWWGYLSPRLWGEHAPLVANWVERHPSSYDDAPDREHGGGGCQCPRCGERDCLTWIGWTAEPKPGSWIVDRAEDGGVKLTPR